MVELELRVIGRADAMLLRGGLRQCVKAVWVGSVRWCASCVGAAAKCRQSWYTSRHHVLFGRLISFTESH